MSDKYWVDDEGYRRYYVRPSVKYKPKTTRGPYKEYEKKKPADPDAVYLNGVWYLPLKVQPDEARVMPETRPDSQGKGHALKCRCHVCRRPGGRAYKHQKKIQNNRDVRRALRLLQE